MGKNSKNALLQALNLVSALGLTLVSTLAVGIGIGRLWDHYFATYPWGTIIGIALGALAGCVGVFKLIVASQKN
ncbi:MAG: AtpZ/AtpI family protein [Sporomusaceae bacterium]|nr:AtpZ/AtpI family protein [Sporomusaceae bacterium]